MTYTVPWSPEDAAELVGLLPLSVAPQDVVRAARAADLRLRTDPDRVGESRPSGARIMFEPPLGLLFEVRWRQQVVRVLHVWHVWASN